MKTSSKTILSLLFIFSLTSLLAQRQTTLFPAYLGVMDGSEKWIQFNPDSKISVTSLWNEFGKEMGLGTQDAMSLVNSETDKLGWSHHRFQQLYKGIPVEFALYRIHEKAGSAMKGNGEIAKDIHINVTPALSREEALELALQCIGAGSYYWQYPGLEEMKRHATDDPSATFYPAGELLIADKDFDSYTAPVYHLAWKFEIYAFQPEGRYWVYVDAHTGGVVKELNLDMHDHGFPGTAETRYSGHRSIVSDSSDVGFFLRDHTRGRGVETYDALHLSNELDAINFYDEDNYWANANERADDAATDAHWGAEMYYDYLFYRHGFDSYDNHGSKLICYVHVGQSWYNASWNGFWTRFGDAGGNPWTFIDVVGHEFTHGFTWATAGLLYRAEPGALNESFSDIIGEALQHYTDGGIVDWYATPSPVDTIRNYRDPNAYGAPDTYHGEHWEFGESDNYGVHTNSGVQNHWFYLLVEGGSGVNDHGDAFTVAPIGFEQAMDVVIRNLSVYLFPTSGYFDARQGSMQAAEDVFGPCSFEYQQVANAWHAVGVGERVEAQDFTILEVAGKDLCNVNTREPVSMLIKYLGCDSSGPVTLYLKLFKSNPIFTLIDTLHLAKGIAGGEVIEYVFSKEIDFARKGEHFLTGEVISDTDPNRENDVSAQTIIHNLSQLSAQSFRFHNRIALRTFRDSIAFNVGEFADLAVLSNVGKDSTYGIRIEGDRLWYAQPIYRYDNPFDYNPRLGTQICFCVDATGKETMELKFDLRQTWSNAFQDMVSGDQQKSSVMRISVDGNELIRYWPETHTDDPWTKRTVDLTDFAGTEFTLCFETRTMISQEDDHTYGIGDRVFLDNILFGEDLTTATRDIEVGAPLVIYPNPAGEIVYVELPALQSTSVEVILLDLHGKVIAKQEASPSPGVGRVQLDVAALASGVYVVEVRTEGERRIGRVVVE